MKNTCVVKGCGNKGVWWHGAGLHDVFCEQHKELGVAPVGEYGPESERMQQMWAHRRYGMRLHEGKSRPRKRKDIKRWTNGKPPGVRPVWDMVYGRTIPASRWDP